MEPRVLVVDDDAVVGKSFERVLTGKGYAVETAMSGKEAFEKYAGGEFDAVFMDLRMPGQDGLEVAKRIKEMNPWLPLVIVTGYGTEEAEATARQIGVDGFVHKPLTPSMIEDLAVRMVAKKESRAHVEAAVPVAEPRRESVARNLALFFAAPFVGLAYMIAFPFVGFGALLRWGLKSAHGKKSA